jgi:hypothetical protein
MDYISSIAQVFPEMLAIAYQIFIHGGWIGLLIVFLAAAYKVNERRIQTKFVDSHKQVFLHVKVEKENEKSIRAVDAMFAQLHAMQANLTWAEVYLEGRLDLWVSFEIVSIGGKISYIIRVPDKFRHLLESSIYSSFPNAEIVEVEDYMKNLKHWTPDSDWDLWGTEYKFTHDFVYPIRTYKDFEHSMAEEKILDPLAGLLEALSKFEEHELFSVQIVIQPVTDASWQPHVKEIVQGLKGEEVHKQSILGSLLNPLNILGEKHVFEMISEKKQIKHEDETGKNIAPVMRLSEGEKNIIAAIEEKGSRVGYNTKIRNLYIAPKEKFDLTKRTGIIGAFRALGGAGTLNNLKPDVNHTWTNYNYKLFKKLERPFVQYMINLKKHHLLEGFVKRSMYIGANKMLMNSEELATLFHFPLLNVKTPPVESIDVKKGQPPADLPIL